MRLARKNNFKILKFILLLFHNIYTIDVTFTIPSNMHWFHVFWINKSMSNRHTKHDQYSHVHRGHKTTITLTVVDERSVQGCMIWSLVQHPQDKTRELGLHPESVRHNNHLWRCVLRKSKTTIASTGTIYWLTAFIADMAAKYGAPVYLSIHRFWLCESLRHILTSHYHTTHSNDPPITPTRPASPLWVVCTSGGTIALIAFNSSDEDMMKVARCNNYFSGRGQRSRSGSDRQVILYSVGNGRQMNKILMLKTTGNKFTPIHLFPDLQL